MEQRLAFKMAKQSTTNKPNGFTMLELMVVVLVVSVLLHTLALTPRPDRLGLFSRQLLLTIQSEQFKAFESRQSRQIVIDKHAYETVKRKVEYPASISCTPQVLLFTNKGNIAKGGSVTCSQGSKSVRLVFQLGTGKGRIDYV